MARGPILPGMSVELTETLLANAAGWDVMKRARVCLEHLCTCREAREWGKICAHSVAVGLHWLKGQQPEVARVPADSSVGGETSNLRSRKAPALERDVAGEPAELFIILPPNFEQAIARGKV